MLRTDGIAAIRQVLTASKCDMTCIFTTAQMAEWYGASVSWAVDSGLIPSRVKPMT